MKKYLFLALLIPSLSQAWTLAQIQQNLQVPPGAAKLSCGDDSNNVSYPFTTNAQNGTAAGTDNVKFGFSPTTNVTGPVNGVYTSRGNAAVTVYKNINFYYTDSNGVNKVVVLPAGTYWGNPTSSWRDTRNQSTVFVPSTGLAANMKLTGLPLHMVNLSTGVVYFVDAELKVTITLANGNPANFWLHCI